MSSPRWKEVKEALNAVLEMTPVERSAYLDRMHESDPDLCQEVKSLLLANAEAGEDFLEHSPAPETLRLGPGTRIGAYQITELLAVGGMGEVYRAHDARLNRKVAIKVLPRAFSADPERLRRFGQEARAVAALSHPNVAHIYEIGECEGLRYIAMEYVQGETLRARIAQGGVKPELALEIAEQIASALAAAHAAGIVHRDIKPENIMVRPDGLVKVLDFGLAKLTEATTDTSTQRVWTDHPLVKSQPGILIGTVSYMSPEQALRNPVDARTDVWSLGVVLYELITSRHPFEGSTATKMMASIVDLEPSPLPQDVLKIAPRMQHILGRALQKSAEKRYQTTKELLEDLRAVKDELALHSRAGRARRFMARHRLIFVALTVVLLALLVFAIRLTRRDDQAIDSIAVVPLANQTGDPAMDYVSSGVAEGLIENLSQLSGLRVISRNAAFRYSGPNINPHEIGRELNVRAVLTGRIESRGKILVISLELVDTRDERRLWGRQYNREPSDLLTLVADISRSVPSGLRLRVTGPDQQKLARTSTVNSDAYQFYLKGRHFLYGRGEDKVKAMEYFEKAIQADPKYARAYAALSFSYLVLGVGDLAPGEAEPKAKEAALKAIELDPMLVEAHISLGQLKFITEWDFAGGLREFERALELNPDDEEANEFYGIDLGFMDRHEEGIAHLKRALQVNPFSPIANVYLGQEYRQAGQEDMAVEQFKNCIEMNFGRGPARSWLAEVYEEKKMYKEALAELSKMPPDDQGTMTSMGYVYAVTGKHAEARKMLRKIKELSKKRYVTPSWVALVYVGLGQKDEAFKWLEKGYVEHSPRMLMIKHDRRFDSLRSDPRFHLMPEIEQHN